MNAIVVHYKELALKGRNRPWFVQHLVRNLRTAIGGLDVRAVRSVMGRIEIELRAPTAHVVAQWRSCAIGSATCLASRTFRTRDGRRMSSPRWPRPSSPTSETRRPPSFRVSARRADKQLPFTSPHIEREVGGLIKEAKGWRVSLDDPALTIHVEMMPDHAFYYFGKEPGAGGLPTGTGGRVACLLSGGIDSPVAAYRMMRRGCSVLLIHFHSYPILSRASQEKVREIAALLTRYQLRSRLHLVPFGELQQQILLAVPPELRVVIYRRLMLRIAEKLARRWRARALVTGEVVGQVASQTLENLTTIAGAATMEVLQAARRHGQGRNCRRRRSASARFPFPSFPDQDCCQLFTPRHPATRARPERDRGGRARAADRRHGGRGDRRGRRGGVPIPDAWLSARSHRLHSPGASVRVF